jgi:hypothetical protein
VAWWIISCVRSVPSIAIWKDWTRYDFEMLAYGLIS